jgi:hypothetical protein
VRELLAVLFVAEPDAEAELFQNVQEQKAVTHDCFHFFAEFHRRGLHGAFEGQQRLAAFHPHPKDAATKAQLIVRSIEEAIFLQTAASQRGGTRGENRLSRFLGIAKSQFDLSL